VLGNLARRLVDIAVLAFAAYAFVFVPLGKRTALEHIKAILATEDSAKAGQELRQAGQKLAHKLIKIPDSKTMPAHGKPVLPDLAPANMQTAANEPLICAPDDAP